MKKLFGCVCVCQVVLPVLLVLCTIAGLKANNIRVDGKTRVTGFIGDTAVIEVNLLWDNSWRDDFNWDAAWVFFKFKKRGLENPWQHAYLGSSGHVLSASAGNEGGGYAYMAGANGGKVNGLYVMRNSISEGNVSVRLQAKWPLTGTGLTKSDFGDALDKIYVAAHAIEMVYIPYNSYYLGDGFSNLCFHEAYGTERNPIRQNGYKNLDASSVYGGNTLHPSYGLQNAIDNNISSHYHSAGNSDEWFAIDFGGKKEMHYFTIRTHYGGSGYYLEGSNDGSNWSVLWSGNGSAWNQTLSKHRITNPGAYRYYRFRETGNYLVIYDVALWEQEVPPLRIDSEELLYYSITRNNLTEKLQLPAAYPKGYAGFYVMKYETSQEQYVEFLNSLTLEQQKVRVANNNFSTMKKGDYVFGDLHTPSCRNGIAFVEQRKPGAPVVFGNNLNPGNDFFSTDDGQTLACNYMSVEDMTAYCSWSGLRPMSELEYEKACRRPYPQLPAEGEYAWNSSTGVNALGSLNDLAYAGEEREQSNSAAKNVNSGISNKVNGPVRCGLFANTSSNQVQAGATYWGVMEMSGNLKELCANVNYTTLDGGSCGTGVYNANLWDKTANKYGVRGGGYNSEEDRLRTSDRTEMMGYFTAITQRDSTVGFRGVYSLSNTINIDAGEIDAPTKICPQQETEIASVRVASCTDFSDMRFQYNWYVKKPGESLYSLIENEASENLTYEGFSNTTSNAVTYWFKRICICALGRAESNEISVTVGTMPTNIPSVPPSYNSIVGTQFNLPCIIEGQNKSEWKTPEGNILPCDAAQVTTSASPEIYQVYFVNEHGCKGEVRDVIVKGFTGLSSIPKHAKVYQELGATLDGVYMIDPDGPGGNEPLPIYSSMTHEGGGWMLIVNSLSNTSVSTLFTTGIYNKPYLGNIYMPHKFADAWINLIDYDMYWTEGRDACKQISNSYWKASECNGGGTFATQTYRGEYPAVYCCYRRYGNAAMTTQVHEGVANYRRCMFDDDRGADAYFIWPYRNNSVYVEWGHTCSYNSGNGEYRIWVR